MITSEIKFDLRDNPDFPRKISVKSVDISTMVDDLMKDLGAKQKLVLSGRFGISGREPLTLDAIGKSLNITRERVRQIEADALNILKKKERSSEIEKFFSVVSEIISERGGIVKKEILSEEVFEKFFGQKLKDSSERYKMEVLFSVIGLKKIKGSRELEESWANSGFDPKRFRWIVSEIENIFDASKSLLSEDDVLKKIDHSDLAKNESKIFPEEIVNYLEISKKFGKNIFDNWGKAKWPLIRPRGVREKAILVLLNRKKPLHFKEISQLIEKTGLSEKKVHPQTVHNELIREKRFVLVGRGTYALREWGYEEGTVKDIIASVIRSAGGILAKDEIVKNVLKKRKVKKETIDVNLSDKKVFVKSKGGYSLK